jgi:hypothetical protein
MVAVDALLAQALLGLLGQALEDPLPGLVVVTTWRIESHSAVAYSGWLPTSR